MKLRTFVQVMASVATLVACGGGDDSPGLPSSAAEDERGSVGPGSPAAIYCEKSGYTATGDDCVYPDGTRCEQWAFYRGTCGQQHSYCATHGGTLTSEEVDSEGMKIVKAFCTVNGKRCEEEDFYRAGTCS